MNAESGEPGNEGHRQYAVKLAGPEVWREMIKCQAACPVHTDSRGYVRALAAGEDELAYLIARGPNPLASICGRVCGAPCEAACRRGALDQPVAIRALKRFVCEQFGPEARPGGAGVMVDFLREAAGRHAPRQCQGREELLPLLQAVTLGEIPPATGQSVGIIGSGPAGLAAAHDLALLGFQVTIYEMEPVLAGMLATGIPEYRLPRALIQSEVDAILALGVKARTRCRVGVDVTFAELRRRHEAVVVAVGAKKSRRLTIAGGEAEGVIGGVEFLRDVALGQAPRLGPRVVVIGGGNVAYDVGRTVLRQIALDAARTARREPGVAQVHLCSLESLEEMPADDVEILEGAEEGVIRHNSLGPREIVADAAGRVRAVRFQRCLRVYDERRCFNPLFAENEITEIPCDLVLLAIGQVCDLSFIDPARDGVVLTPRGTIACDPQSGRTATPDLFVAGDLATGPKLLIHAVASGKAVARTIYQHLTGRTIREQSLQFHLPLADYSREPDYEKPGRAQPPTLPVSERLAGQDRLVEGELSAAQARREAGRCLDCGVNTIFSGERCILCGGCVDVCPQTCLRIAGLAQMQGGGEVDEAVARQLDGYPAEEASAIIKDETICIRCGQCAERCPTGAITMERFHCEERMQCPAV